MSSVLDEIDERYARGTTVGTDWGTLRSLARLAERVPDLGNKCGGVEDWNQFWEVTKEIRAILHPTPPAPVAPEGPWRVIRQNDIWTLERIGYVWPYTYPSHWQAFSICEMQNRAWREGWLAGKGAS